MGDEQDLKQPVVITDEATAMTEEWTTSVAHLIAELRRAASVPRDAWDALMRTPVDAFHEDITLDE